MQEDAEGVKNAARRKLEHELGIPPEDVPYDSFTWLTRVHYVGQSIAPKKPVAGSAGSPGADVPGVPSTAEPVDSHAANAAASGALQSVADAPDSIWGEHEIDWILMCKPKELPRFNLNSNEVAAVRCFTQEELREWMRTRHDRGEEVSPWFGIMEKSGLVYKWWDAVLGQNGLDLASPQVVQREKIHRQHELEALASGEKAVPMQRALVASKTLTEQSSNAAAAADDKETLQSLAYKGQLGPLKA
jgi:isopentenyldiphosphate isomerase